MKITILVDDEKSWFVPYAKDLKEQLKSRGWDAELIHSSEAAAGGDICFLLSCSKIVKRNFLEKYLHNIVVHASDLPKGKGFTPMKWQILEGKNDIVLTLFEAVEFVDAGEYYIKEGIHFNGTELLGELHRVMAEKINDMCMSYAADSEKYVAVQQQGEESFYPRFSKEDDRIDIYKSIDEQFNHFRIADNDRYPLWFERNGKKYVLKIEEYGGNVQ